MSWTLCTSGAAIAKAGVYANATLTASTATLAEWSNESEGTFSMKCRIDWVAAIATTDTMIKQAIADAVSSDIGNKILNGDPSGYSRLNEAKLIANINKDTYDTILKDLREDNNQKLNK